MMISDVRKPTANRLLEGFYREGSDYQSLGSKRAG